MVAPKCRSSEIFQGIFQRSTFSSEVKEQEKIKKVALKGSRDTGGLSLKHGGKARKDKVMEEIC